MINGDKCVVETKAGDLLIVDVKDQCIIQGGQIGFLWSGDYQGSSQKKFGFGGFELNMVLFSNSLGFLMSVKN